MTFDSNQTVTDQRVSHFLERYQRGEWRAPLFRDLLVDEIAARRDARAVLDIGCGSGLDNDLSLQESVATASGSFWGVEPDLEVKIPSFFDKTFRSTLEEAPINDGQIDVAYSIMVLEHLSAPHIFWDQVHRILRPSGVFWAMTVDERSPFAIASSTLQVLGIKDLYMRFLLGRRGEDSYLNYPTYYRSNTPAKIARLADSFALVQVWSVPCLKQHRAALPRWLHLASDAWDSAAVRFRLPGTLLLVRAEK